MSAPKYHTKQTGYLVAKIDAGSPAASTTFGSLENAVVINAGVVVKTAFNATTGNSLDIGTDGDPNGFATLLSISSAGLKAADELATSNDLVITSEDNINFDLTFTGTPTTGEAYVFVEYLDIDNLAAR